MKLTERVSLWIKWTSLYWLIDYVQLDTQPLTLSSFGILQIKQFLCNYKRILKEISNHNLQ